MLLFVLYKVHWVHWIQRSYTTENFLWCDLACLLKSTKDTAHSSSKENIATRQVRRLVTVHLLLQIFLTHSFFSRQHSWDIYLCILLYVINCAVIMKRRKKKSGCIYFIESLVVTHFQQCRFFAFSIPCTCLLAPWYFNVV